MKARLTGGPLSSDLVIPLKVSAGTATVSTGPDADVEPLTSVTIPAGKTDAGDTSGSVDIAISDDSIEEPDEEFTVEMVLENGAPAAAGTAAPLTVTISAGDSGIPVPSAAELPTGGRVQLRNVSSEVVHVHLSTVARGSADLPCTAE